MIVGVCFVRVDHGQYASSFFCSFDEIGLITPGEGAEEPPKKKRRAEMEQRMRTRCRNRNRAFTLRAPMSPPECFRPVRGRRGARMGGGRRGGRGEMGGSKEGEVVLQELQVQRQLAVMGKRHERVRTDGL
jgi:hypothetical protein